MGDPQAIRLDEEPQISTDRGVFDRELFVEGVRWAVVEYSAGSGRAHWCETPHLGYVVDGRLRYEFEDGRPPLELEAGMAFSLPAAPRHRGFNPGNGKAHLFLIDVALG